jgi:hypothetical protein
MTARRALILIPALLVAFLASDSFAAQGRGKAGKQGNGPAFCRNGQGHPVHGWQWCEDKGWDRSGSRIVQRDRRGRIVETGRVTENRRRGTRGTSFALDQGYTDGYDKGLEDSEKNRSFDPTRHSWYRAADREYDSRYGDKNAYKNEYREGFRAGYDEGFRDRERYDTRTSRSGDDDRTNRGSGTAVPRRWPF